MTLDKKRSSFYTYTYALQEWLDKCHNRLPFSNINDSQLFFGSKQATNIASASCFTAASSSNSLDTHPAAALILQQSAWQMAQRHFQQQYQTQSSIPSVPPPPYSSTASENDAPGAEAPGWPGRLRQVARGFYAFAQGDAPDAMRNVEPAPPNLGLQGLRFRIPSIWKRLCAELIDYIIVFVIRAAFVLLLSWRWPLREVAETIDLDLKLLSQRVYSKGTFEFNALDFISPEMLVTELLNRVGVALFEAMCITWLHTRAGDYVMGTPGKWLMGLRVVSCAETIDLPEVIEVVPGRRVTFFNALLRSLVKNLAILFFLPVCITAIFFHHHRATYDILAGTVVVESAPPRNED